MTDAETENDVPDLTGREERLATVFISLADTYVETFDVDEFLSTLCERTRDTLGVQAVGVLLENVDGDLQVSSATSRTVEEIDLFEMQAQEGPCYDAYLAGKQVVAPDLSQAREWWPQFTDRAIGAGFQAVYAFPLRLRDDCIGAMNLFRTTPGPLDDRDLTAGQALADMATIGLLSQRRLAAAETRAAQLQGALESRVVIEQAKGMLAARAGIHPDAAFDLLRRYARSRHQQLRDVCAAIVDGTLDLA